MDEALEILTGVPAGERNGQGEYPGDSVNGLVESTLKRYVLDLRAFARPRDTLRDRTGLAEDDES